MGPLEGRRVLVTGASSGIGEATARAVAEAGGRVALLARRADRLAAIAAEVDGVAVPADVTDEAAVGAAVDAAAAHLGGLDGLVNAAGLLRLGGLAEGHPDDWRRMLDVNVLGVLLATRAAVPHLRAAGGGNVVNVGSMSGRRLGSASSMVYAGTKFALRAISEGMRRELHGDGIRITVVSPGFVDTPLFEDLDDGARERYRRVAAETGLDPGTVATHVVQAVAAPPDVTVYEVALYHTGQD